MNKYIFTLYLLLVSMFSQGQISEVSFSDKINESTLVVEGKIISSTSFYDDNQHNIYTAHEVALYKMMKGSFSGASKIYVLTPGGTIQNEALEVFPSLSLTNNEVGTFLLKANNVTINNSGLATNLVFMPVASSQSKYNYNCSDGTVNGLFQSFPTIDDFYAEITNLTVNTMVEVSVYTSCSTSNRPENREAIEISGFSPAIIPAGAEQKLTITGSGFGDTFSEQKVWFRNNSNTKQWQAVSSSLIVANTWSDTQIEVYVPDIAGTGKVAVSANESSSLVYSNESITVPYAELNSNDLQTQHINDNTLGGYTWEMSTDFNKITAAKNAFTRALENWTCHTNINWNLSATVSNVNTTASDGVNIVHFDDELSSGVLGLCYNRWSYCVETGDRFVRELDIVFNSNKTWNFSTNSPTENEHDFETVVLHELGHGRQLHHVIDSNKVMHHSLGRGIQKRVLTQDEIDGGLDIQQRSTTVILCNQLLMTNETCATASVVNFSFGSINIYPNPTSDYLNFNTHSKNIIDYQIFNILGEELISGTVNSNAVLVSYLKNGIYFLKLNTLEGSKTLKFIKE